MRAWLWLIVVVTVASAAGCSLGNVLAQSDLFAGNRPDVAKSCCTCLHDHVPPAGEACTTVADGGVVTGGGCLCTGNTDTCSAALLDAGTIVLVGGCVQSGGACFDACSGALTFDTAQ
jgi:hypothetical protein